MAMCVIAMVGDAPCQCFSPGGNQTTSPGRISSTGPPRAAPAAAGRHDQRLAQRVRVPRGACPRLERDSRATDACRPLPWNGASIRTVPVNHSSGPLADAWVARFA